MVCLRVLSRTNPPPRSTPNSFRFRTSAQPCILHCFGANKSFRIRTYRHPSCNPFRIRTYRNTGGWGASPLVQGLRVSVSLPAPALSGWQIPCSQQLAASCTSLCAFFRTPFLCFQELAASFSKTPGVGVPQHFRADLRFRRHMRHVAPLLLRPHSIAHTSRHDGGVCTPTLPISFLAWTFSAPQTTRYPLPTTHFRG